MKSIAVLAIVIFGSVPLVQAIESKRTAEYVLANPGSLENQKVSVDVAFVKPMEWKSPSAELAFFRAITIDRRDHKSGGDIMVAVPSDKAAAFSKKYGMDFERGQSTPLEGTLVAAPGRGGMQRWVLDTSGKLKTLIEQKKIERIEGGDGDGPRGAHKRKFRGD